ncbi:MAG: DUF6505 family protein [Pseudomonadota bacterium]
MKLARAIHFDDSDTRVFHSPAQTGEWCISGGFEFSNWTDGDMVGRAKQAFANGWIGLDTFGRVSLVAVAPLEDFERDALVQALAQHFVAIYGAPSIDAAFPVAQEEIVHMIDLCDAHAANTLLTVSRTLTEAGVRESYSVIESQSAGIEQFAVHGSLDDDSHRH